MASEQQYSPEFKTQVAQEALDQSKENLQDLAKKYNIPVSVVITWTTQYENHGSDAFREEPVSQVDDSEQPIEDQKTVDVEISNSEIAESLSYGAMKDRLNYRRLTFWSVLGTVLFIIFVRALVEMFQYNAQVTRERVSGSSEYYNVQELNAEAYEKLNSFGIVNLENNIYRIPLDSAINELTAENN